MQNNILNNLYSYKLVSLKELNQITDFDEMEEIYNEALDGYNLSHTDGAPSVKIKFMSYINFMLVKFAFRKDF